ncbi:MAG: TonB-dependent receptor [Bacteroidota bacterium]
MQAQSEKYNLSGLVFDEGTHLLSGATIFIPELQLGAVSDDKGTFIIKEVPAGEYKITVRYLGYSSLETNVKIPNDAPLEFHLEGEFHLLNELTVEGKPVSIALENRETISGESLQKIRGASLAESVTSITGVTMLQTGPAISKPVIHGLHSNRVLILNNGVRQEGQQWGTEHAPEIDPFTAQKLTVIKGAAAVRYGSDAVAGVLLVEPPELPESENLQGEVNLVGTSNGRQGIASVMLANGSDKLPGLGWRVQSSAKKAGDFHAPNYELTNTGVQEVNFSGEVGYKNEKWGGSFFYSLFTSELGILRSAHIGSTTDLLDAIERERPFFIEDFSYEINNPKQDIAHQLAKAKGFYNFNEKSKLSFHIAQQVNSRKEFDIRRGGRSNRPAIDLRLQTLTAELIWEKYHDNNWNGTFGITWLDQKNRNIPGTGVRPLIPNYLSNGLGVFAIENYAKNKWELEFGARFDYRRLEVFRFNEEDELETPIYNFTNFSVSGSAKYRFNESLQYTVNLATAFRPPNVSELFSEGLHHGTATIEEGNENLVTEKAFKWINTFSYNKAPFTFTTNFYYQRIQDFIYQEPLSEPRLTIRGAFPVFAYQQTDARLAGLDADLAVKLHPNVTFESRYSMVRARDLTRGAPLIFMPADRFENGLRYNKQRDEKIYNWFVQLNTAYVAEQTRVPGIDYTPPPESYFLLNVQAGAKFKINELDTGISVSVNNALNTTYRDYLNRFRYYADDLGRNIILRLHANF